MKKLVLTLKDDNWEKLRVGLLQSDSQERQAFLELGLREDDHTLELLLHKGQIIADADYVAQGRYHVAPHPRAVVEAYNSFNRSGVLVHGHVHSHPFAQGDTAFSAVDRQTLDGMRRGLADIMVLQGLGREAFCFQLVLGQTPESFQGTLINLKGDILGNLGEIKVVGPGGIHSYGTQDSSIVPVSKAKERWDRNIRWLGEAGQQKLSRTHLAVCGLGGVGALLVANIRGLGFKEVTLVDPERLEVSNLNRFVGAGIEDVGSFKVDICRREIRRVSPETEVHAFTTGVEDAEVLKRLQEADLIIAALDGMRPRAELQVLAARFLKPFFDLGSGIQVDPQGKVRRLGSQIITYIPGGPCLACQGLDLFRPTEGIAGEVRRRTGYVVGTPEAITPTSVTTINSVVAGWTVDLVIKYLTGLAPIPLYTQIDQWRGTVEQMRFKKKDSCPICGLQGIEGKGEDRMVLPAPRVPTTGLKIDSEPGPNSESPPQPQDRGFGNRVVNYLLGVSG
jgi:molybdopterin/thiamine biosynthesis adenylyltransferase